LYFRTVPTIEQFWNLTEKQKNTTLSKQFWNLTEKQKIPHCLNSSEI
jgi:DNA polymerase IIIc chi subunit